MLKGTRVRVTRDCIDASTGKVWIERGQLGTLMRIEKHRLNSDMEYGVKLDDGRNIWFRRESIAPLGAKIC